MAQKERYELHESNKNFIEIFDNVRDKWITEDNICEYLNNYDKKVRELELYISTVQNTEWESLREENRKLIKELDKYKETVQELQETSSKMFDKLLENHLSKFQENHYNEENEEFKNDIKLLISVSKQIKDFKNSQKQIAIRELEKLKESCEKTKIDIGLMLDYTTFNNILDKQIESLKGE